MFDNLNLFVIDLKALNSKTVLMIDKSSKCVKINLDANFVVLNEKMF